MWSVYEIQGPTGKYIGKTGDPEQRWKDHCYGARKKPKQVIHLAMRKHGIENFSFRVLVQSSNEDDIFFCERAVIAQHKNEGVRLYNVTDGGEGTSGIVRSDETRRKVSEAQKLRLSKNNPSTGTRRTKEQRQRMSDAQKQRLQDPGAGAREHLSRITLLANAAVRGKIQDATARANKRAGRLRYLQESQAKELSIGSGIVRV